MNPVLAQIATINEHRIAAGEPPLSFREIGHACGYSKPTVGAVILGTYKAATAPRILRTITAYLATLAPSQCPSVPVRARPCSSAPSTRSTKPRKAPTSLVSREGYLSWRYKSYYAGSAYANTRVAVKALGAGYLQITGATGNSRLVRPIDPTINDLNYHAQEHHNA